MPTLDNETKACLEILKILDETLDDENWEKTLFLRGISKRLHDVRDRFSKNLGLEELLKEIEQTENGSTVATQQQNPEVYIALYQAQGNDFRKWGVLLESLAKHSISRPVYKSEEDVKAAIRAKEFKVNDAYVVVRVQADHILSPIGGKPLLDRFGRELLTIKENAIQIANIVRFVHVTGQYRYVGKMLIRQPGTEDTLR